MTSPGPELVHLVCGPTGAGKSTYSEKLTQALGGVRFSIDEWMERLHNPDKPDQASFEWFYDRVQRNCAQMRVVAERLAELGTPSVFDCGLTNSTERAIFADWAEGHGFSYRLHFVDVPVDIRWTRVERRNRERAGTFQFHVDRGMFDFIEALWEPPNAAEHARMAVTVIGP